MVKIEKKLKSFLLNLAPGILNGFVPLTKDGALDLDHVLLKSGCNCCDKELSCTVRQALYQPEYGGDQGGNSKDNFLA